MQFLINNKKSIETIVFSQLPSHKKYAKYAKYGGGTPRFTGMTSRQITKW